ncbi:lytic transglycosylase domain-containing protein [Vannielia litorea]|uniref:Transglycosylase SLT domain-containing protein n=1 Tax=Vannielia litorea TaxID=1217970 RepID=A0A1N6ETA2_9RHOB|nr:lytic transglycosylase domain-containing protein [Vannielia litorea]SIN86322.1 Transglycosylase SLT domain-containing protein [Vannielia litorea]
MGGILPISAALVALLLLTEQASAEVSALRPVARITAMGGELPPGLTPAEPQVTRLRPKARPVTLPRTRWENVPGSTIWTRAAISALKAHGRPLLEFVPRDIAQFCPSYASQPLEKRAEFWVGFLSALAKHESTYRPRAVGGGGRWHGLLQITPSTARLYGCRAGTAAALLHGPTNLSCAVRIMSKTVRRDGVVGANGRGGVAADWGPMVYRAKRADIAAYTRVQSYCRPLSSVRPKARPTRG